MPPTSPDNGDFDAELYDWVLVSWPSSSGNWPIVFGRVMNDRKGRFPDGRRIHTSVVISPPAEIASGHIIQTLNTRYLLRGTKH
jgi:hypothetical protein